MMNTVCIACLVQNKCLVPISSPLSPSLLPLTHMHQIT